MLDLAIIGGGPAALSAALYAARAGLNVQVYENADFGGILPNIAQLDNYPGFSGAGKELADIMRSQASAAGAKLSFGECTAVELAPLGDNNQDDAYSAGPISLERGGGLADAGFRLTIDGDSVLARTVLIATGSHPKQLSFTPAAPVSYCALCDGPLVKGKHIAVIGGANSAVQEALYLAALAKDVAIITHSQMKADAELMDRLHQTSNIRVIEHLEPTSENLAEFDHIFVYIGKRPSTGCLEPLAQGYAILSHDSYVLSDVNNSQYPHQTVIPGLFAAGDVRDGAIKQVITAAADGAAAAIEITNLLKSF